MTKYAYFDHTEAAPQRVRGWFDTDQFTYPKLPDTQDLLILSEAEWAGRMRNPSGWAVSNGTLIVRPPSKAPVGPVSITIPKPSG